MHVLRTIWVAVVFLSAGLAHGQAAQLQAPQLDPVAKPEALVAGAAGHITCRVSWEGAPEDFQVSPVEVDPVEGATISVEAASAYSQDGKHVVEQRVAIVPDVSGTLTLPELRVPYAASGAGESVEPPGYLVVPALTIEVVAANTRPVWVLPATVVALVLVLLIAIWLFRARAKANGPTSESPAERVGAMLHQAQRQRLDGDHYAFYQTLVVAMREVAQDEDARKLKDKLEQRARAVGYQGTRPPDDELTGDYRDVERAVARWKEELGA